MRVVEKLASARSGIFFAERRDLNGRPWDIEDAIRGCEAERGFDGRLVELAQVAYRTN